MIAKRAVQEGEGVNGEPFVCLHFLFFCSSLSSIFVLVSFNLPTVQHLNKHLFFSERRD